MKLRPGWKRVKAGLYEKRQKGGLSAPWNERVLGLVVPEVYLVRKKSSTRWQMQEKETPRSRAHNIGTDTTASRAMARLDQRYKNDPPVRGFRREGSKIVPLSPPPKRRAPSRPRQTWGEWWRSLWAIEGQAGQGRRVDEYQVVGEAKRRGIGDATIHGPFKTLKLARQFQRDVRDRGIQDGDGKQQHFITAPYMENNQYWVDIAYYFHTPEGTGVKYSARGRRASISRSFDRYEQMPIWTVYEEPPSRKAAQFPATVYGAKKAKQLAHRFHKNIQRGGDWQTEYAKIPEGRRAKRTTIATVNRSLRELGIPGKLVRGEGYYYMIDLDEEPEIFWAVNSGGDSIYVYSISDWSVDEVVGYIEMLGGSSLAAYRKRQGHSARGRRASPLTAGTMSMFKEYRFKLRPVKGADNTLERRFTLKAMPGGWLFQRKGYAVKRLNKAKADVLIEASDFLGRER